MPESKIEKNKTVYRRFLSEVFSQGRIDLVNELVSPSYVYRDAPPGAPAGREEIAQVVGMMRSAFPDLTLIIEDMIGEGELVSARTTIRGTHRGEIFGVPATGKPLLATGLTMARVVDGKLVESWVKNDIAAAVQKFR